MSQSMIHLITAARPNMMKIAPLYQKLAAIPWAHPVLVHTGQHYDDALSGVFLRTLGLPQPDFCLGVGSGTHAEQTGRTMIAYEALCQKERPALTIVVGDVNATVACALAAKKLQIPVGHLEAGLRSFDRTMPEEINRLATDSIADWLWTPSPDATAQLLRENVAAQRIREVGNMMIDSFCLFEPAIRQDQTRQSLGLKEKGYGLLTFHRPSNVDAQDRLSKMVERMEEVSTQLKLVFPVHPRTRHRLEDFGLYHRLATCPGVVLCPPLSYISFMNLVLGAKLVLTDSGGLQEETTYLGIPCLTLRSTTERPLTLTQGTNQLVTLASVGEKVEALLGAPPPKRPLITGWDGHAAQRTVDHLREILQPPLSVPSEEGVRHG